MALRKLSRRLRFRFRLPIRVRNNYSRTYDFLLLCNLIIVSSSLSILCASFFSLKPQLISSQSLVCMQRSNYETVPGCSGSEFDQSNDYCHGRPSPDHLWIVGDDGAPASAFPLKKCDGDCDSDDQCEGELKCLQRGGDEEVPGCIGTYGVTKKDYCYDLNPSPQTPPPTPSPVTSIPTNVPTPLPTSLPTSKVSLSCQNTHSFLAHFSRALTSS